MNIPLDNAPTATEQFTYYLTHGLLKKMEALLDENGEFEIQDNKQQSKKVAKKPFVKWIKSRWKECGWSTVPEPEMNLYIDTCSDCNKGCKVHLFEYGHFPYAPDKSGGTRPLRGMLIKESNGKIVCITGCSQFEETTNPMQFEILQMRVDEIMQEQKCNYMTAFITAHVEMYGKHTIDIDSDFIMFCKTIDEKIRNEQQKTTTLS